MVKAYWVAHVDVQDPVAYEAYRQANAAAFIKYNARVLVRGAVPDTREGTMKPRTVVIEFDSMDIARACYDSPEYQAAKALRLPCSEADVIIIEGWQG